MRKLMVCLSMIFLSACATKVTSVNQVLEHTGISFDKFSGVYKVNGMQLDAGGFPNITKYWLRSSIDKDGKIIFTQLYVDHFSQTGWLFLEAAADTDAKLFDVTQISRDVLNGGNIEENVGVNIPWDLIVSKQATGETIKVVGHNGDLTLTLSPIYLQGYVMSMESFQKCIPANNCW